MMFRLLTPEQRKQVTGRFKVRGMKAVFPFCLMTRRHVDTRLQFQG